MEFTRELQQHDTNLATMRENFNKVVEENERRRKNMETSFKEIQTRLDNNKQTMENIKCQIDKVTGVLSRLKEYTVGKEVLTIGDCTTMDEEELLKEKNDLLQATKEDMKEIEDDIRSAINAQSDEI